jgi:hypothetical protein
MNIAFTQSRIGPTLLTHVLLVWLGLFSFMAGAQTPQPSKPCQDAQVISVHGGWVANPGSRHLANWSCVSPGEEVTLAADSKAGDLTVIYHSAAMQPHTVTCESHEKCRNAYRVEAAPAQSGSTKGTVDQVLDFFFSIFQGSEPHPVPGILHGEVILPPRPLVECSYGRRVRLDGVLRPGLYNLEVSALNNEARDITWKADVRANSTTKFWGLWGKRTSEERSWALMTEPLQKPAIYEVTTGPVGAHTPDSNFWIVIAPEDMCRPIQQSYSQAVDYTASWKDVSPEAVQNFRLLYLEGLAQRPDQAPEGH